MADTGNCCALVSRSLESWDVALVPCPGREQGQGPGLRVSQSSVGGLSEGRKGTCLKGPLGEPLVAFLLHLAFRGQ